MLTPAQIYTLNSPLNHNNTALLSINFYILKNQSDHNKTIVSTSKNK